MQASCWGVESHYQLHQARESESKDAGAVEAWVKSFPVQELVKRGVFEKPKSPSATASALLSFFGVGSIEAWQAKYGAANVAYRHSPSFTSDEFALATWLRLTETKATSQTIGRLQRIELQAGTAQSARTDGRPDRFIAA